MTHFKTFFEIIQQEFTHFYKREKENRQILVQRNSNRVDLENAEKELKDALIAKIGVYTDENDPRKVKRENDVRRLSQNKYM